MQINVQMLSKMLLYFFKGSRISIQPHCHHLVAPSMRTSGEVYYNVVYYTVV